MTPELKKAIELEQSYQKEIQKKSYHGKRELSVEEGVDAFYDWGTLAAPYAQYCYEHPEIAKEANDILADIDKKIATVKQRGEREIASHAELKRLQGECARLEKENKKKTRAWLSIGLPIMLLLMVLVYWLVGAYTEVYLHELGGILDIVVYFSFTPGGVILLVPLAFLVVYLVAAGRLNVGVVILNEKYERRKTQILESAENPVAHEIQKLEKSKEPYLNVIQASKSGSPFYYMKDKK